MQHFGLTAFRPGQQRVVEAVFAGRDCLCIMPTGGGKSLCFQLPAVARPGTVLVVSPLIALMQDQVDSLLARDISATFINSSLGFAEQQQRMTLMSEGRYDLVYIAPERMRSKSFLDALRSTHVQLLAIDEAHCISQWGHDFRPDYARLGRLRQTIGSPQTIALTATATRTVRQDVCDVLQLRQPAVFVSGFARENLGLSVATPSSNSHKDQLLERFLAGNPGSGIIYCSTRKACEHLTELLRTRQSRSVAAYHAGRESGERREIQEAFSAGKIDLIVATNAFGMGIDKSNLRFVIHYNLPGSIEAYYQEAGRAGRDGLPARCLMLYSYQDRFIQEFFIENSYPSREIVRQVYEFLCQIPADPVEITLQELQHQLGLSVGTEGIRVSENLLEKSGAIERMDTRENLASVRISSDLPTLVDLLPREARTRRRVLRAVESRAGPLSGERIWFSPPELARQLDMSGEALQRNLRELNQLDCFDYVPPFRGRAVHVVRRVPFHQLDIDFSELQLRKEEEYRRLASVMAFAESRRCRQVEILGYFGDEPTNDCRQCDNCIGRGETADNSAADTPVEDHAGAAYAIQVALSGIARTRGRFGQTLIAQMLCGSNARKPKQLGLDRLSTHGLLKSLSQSEAGQLIDCLIDAGLVRKDEQQRFRPVVQITSDGQESLRGNRLHSALAALPAPLLKKLDWQFRNHQPVIGETVAHSSATPGPPVDENANGGGHSGTTAPEPPPANQETAADRAIHRADVAAGSWRLDGSHGEHTGTRVHPDWYWTWKLYAAGFQASEVLQIRGIPRAELDRHLEMAAAHALPVPATWLDTLQPPHEIRKSQ